MPHSPEHQQKKIKNYILFGIIIAVAIFSFAITIVKIKAASEARDASLENKTEQPASETTNKTSPEAAK